MVKMDGQVINSLPFEGLRKVSDLIEFEWMPLLSHFKDKFNNNILFYWVDYDQFNNRWMVWQVERDTLSQYLGGKINLNSLLLKNNEQVFFADINGDIVYSNIVQSTSVSIPENYKAGDDAYFVFELPEAYTSNPV